MESRTYTDRAGRWGHAFAATWLIALAAGLVESATRPSGQTRPSRPRLKAYPTRYYVLRSDLDANTVREAAARMTAMAEEYHRRTRGFAGVIRKRLPFYLFSRRKDYYAAGGTPGSAGVYVSGRRVLMAVAPFGGDENLWHTVRHEGFHQFADLVIGGDLPIWVNEGLAEYFGEGVWTGDAILTGAIPPYRLKRLREHLRKGRILPFEEMLSLGREDWHDDLRDSYRASVRPPTSGPAGEEPPGREREPTQARVNYDQVWSMVHFLVHAEDGRYRKGFSDMIRDISRGRKWRDSFRRRFGGDVGAFEQRYRDWWLARKPNATAELYVRAVVQTLTSFLARAVARGQTFRDAEDFLRSARHGELKCPKGQWLPPRLLNDALLHARNWRRGWSLDTSGRVPKLLLRWGSERTFTGTFTHARGRADHVKVTVSPGRAK